MAASRGPTWRATATTSPLSIKWAEHVAAINANGMFIDGVRGEMRIPVKAITPDQLQGPLEAILIATKAHHTADAVREVIPIWVRIASSSITRTALTSR